MEYYLLALNLLSLGALIIAIDPWRGRRQRGDNRSVLFLICLTATRAGALLMWMVGAVGVIGPLEIASSVLLTWVFVRPAVWYSSRKRPLMFGGLVFSAMLVLIAFIPSQPLPWQGLALGWLLLMVVPIWRRHDILRPMRMLTVFSLALGIVLDVADMGITSRMMTMLAYGNLLNISYGDASTQLTFYQNELRTIGEGALGLSRYQNRLLSAVINLSAISDLGHSLSLVADSVSCILGAELVAIFSLHFDGFGIARLVGVSKRGEEYRINEEKSIFKLEDYPLLRNISASRIPWYIDSDYNVEGFKQIYALLDQMQFGPTLFQPLTLRNRLMGILLAGNPKSGRSFTRDERNLCQSIEWQLASIVENDRLYNTLEARAEEMADFLQMRSAEAYQRLAILESIKDGVVVSNAVGRITLVNAAAEQILDTRRGDLLGRPIGAIYNKIDSTDSVESLAADFSRGDKPLPIAYEGENMILHGHLHPLRNKMGEWAGTIAIFRDVTQEMRVKRERANFVNTVSRETRSSLTLVKGYVELLLDGLEGDMKPEHRQILEIVHANAERMTGVLNNAVEMVRWQQDEVLLRLHEVDVRELLDEAVRRVMPLAEVRQLSLTKSYPRELPTIQADPDRVLQILDNLLTNACRFTPGGGSVTVSAWTQTERIESINRFGEYVIVAVSDTGIGIEPKYYKRIFERYYRLDNPLSDDTAGGFGIGLAVVKELVQAHGGRVWVESKVGQGSTFHVALPVENPQMPEEGASLPPEMRQPGK